MGTDLPGLPYCFVRFDGETENFFVTGRTQRYSADSIIEDPRCKVSNLIYLEPVGALMLRPYIDYKSDKYDYDKFKYRKTSKEGTISWELISKKKTADDEINPWSIIKNTAECSYLHLRDTSKNSIGEGKIQVFQVQPSTDQSWKCNEGINFGLKLYSTPSDIMKELQKENETKKFAIPSVYFLFTVKKTIKEDKSSTYNYLFEYNKKQSLSLLELPVEYRTKGQAERVWRELAYEAAFTDEGQPKGRDRFRVLASAHISNRGETLAGKDIVNLSFMFLDNGIAVDSGMPDKLRWSPEFFYSEGLVEEYQDRNPMKWTNDPATGGIAGNRVESFETVKWEIEKIQVGVKFASATFFVYPIRYPKMGGFKIFVENDERVEASLVTGYSVLVKGKYTKAVKTFTDDPNEIRFSYTSVPRNETEKLPGGVNVNVRMQSIDGTSTPLFYYYEDLSPTTMKSVYHVAKWFTPISFTLNWDGSGYKGTIDFSSRMPANEPRIQDYLKGIRPVTIFFGRAPESSNVNLDAMAEEQRGKYSFPPNSPFGTIAFKGYFYPTHSLSRTGQQSIITLTFCDRIISVKEARAWMLPIYDGWEDEAALRNLLDFAEYGGMNLITKVGSKNLLSRGKFRLPLGTMKGPKFMYPEGSYVWECMQDIATKAVRWLIPWRDGKVYYTDFKAYDEVFSLQSGGGGYETIHKFEEVTKDSSSQLAFRDELFRLTSSADFSVAYNEVDVMGFTPLAYPERLPNSRVRWKLLDPKEWKPFTASYPYVLVKASGEQEGGIPWRKRWVWRAPEINTQEAADAFAIRIFARNALPYYGGSFSTWGRTDLVPLQLIEIVERNAAGQRGTNPARILPEIDMGNLKPGLENIYRESWFFDRCVYRILNIEWIMTQDKKFTTTLQLERFFGSEYDYPVRYE